MNTENKDLVRLSPDEIEDLFYRHDERTTETFRRMLCILRSVPSEGTDSQRLTKLAREAYGHTVQPIELERDINTLMHLGLISVDGESWLLIPAKETKFWPFGF